MFAVGQEAVGIFALGQMATGVIAIGQIARGVIAIGQGAVGIVAIGQGALGVAYGAAMLGIGGRGFGGVLRVFPKVVVEKFEAPPLPPLTTLAALRGAQVEDGWVLAQLEETAIVIDGARPELELDDEAKGTLAKAPDWGHNRACIRLEAQERTREADGGYRAAAPRERVLVARRMITWKERRPRYILEGPLTHPAGLFLRACALVALAVAWWILAGRDVLAALLS